MLKSIELEIAIVKLKAECAGKRSLVRQYQEAVNAAEKGIAQLRDEWSKTIKKERDNAFNPEN